MSTILILIKPVWVRSLFQPTSQILTIPHALLSPLLEKMMGCSDRQSSSLMGAFRSCVAESKSSFIRIAIKSGCKGEKGYF